VGISLLASSCALAGAAGPAEATRPNIVFVMTDDMRPVEMSIAADLKPGGGFAWVRDHGVRFDKTISTDNLCCPGRATALTGQTAYNHGVLDNEHSKNLQSDSLPVYLRSAGYCTGFTGKYHIYDARVRPAGWTFWEPVLGGEEYVYEMIKRSGSIWAPTDYVTDRMATVTRAQIRDCLASGKPAFVAYWPMAPHTHFDPEPAYADVSVPYGNTDPSYNEADTTDKPAWLQAWMPAQQSDAHYAAKQATHVRTLLSVDDALKSMIVTLDQRGQLENTLFVLTTDNGLLLGEHRVDQRKMLAYEAAQPVLWIAGPGFPAGASSNAYTTNLDVVPTMVRAAGASVATSKWDGRPLQNVLAEPDLGHDRFLPIYVPVATSEIGIRPPGHGVRTWRYKYIAYDDGTEELYDLATDPYELTNQANAPGGWRYLKAAMKAFELTARSCKGATCRASAPAPL
jgi:arylsulfatase A-like enzyme